LGAGAFFAIGFAGDAFFRGTAFTLATAAGRREALTGLLISSSLLLLLLLPSLFSLSELSSSELLSALIPALPPAGGSALGGMAFAKSLSTLN
jgi:hypothetical protein